MPLSLQLGFVTALLLSNVHRDLARMIAELVEQRQVVTDELDGPRYRRGRIATPDEVPEVRGGALIALFFLPTGRTSYDIIRPEETAS